VGTRASLLARTQSTTFADLFAQRAGRNWEEVLVTTPGDDTTKSLNQPGSPGLFVSTLRKALLSHQADVIVHSYKDLPSSPEPGIVLAAVPPRVDPRDALVSRDGRRLADLPRGSRVGTSSPRRAVALSQLRPDLVIVPIRGNVDTRIRKVRDGEVEATVMAMAGLMRIGRLNEVAEVLDYMLPAAAQGALAVECREADTEMRAALALLDDPESRLVTTAERFVLVGINAACTTPVAAMATFDGTRLHLRAKLTLNGRHTEAEVEVECAVEDVAKAATLGMTAAARLSGAARPVLLVRSEGNESDADRLADLGIATISEPYVNISAATDAGMDQSLVDALTNCAADPEVAARTWLVATSPMTVPTWLMGQGESLARAAAAAAAAGVRAAATGARTAATLSDLGFRDVLVPEDSSAAGLLHAIQGEPPSTALFPHGNLALRTLPDGLTSLGWQVMESVVYDTKTVTARPASAALVERSEVSAVVLRSPSAVRALTHHVSVPEDVNIICAGRTTAQAATEAGLTIAAVAPSPSSPDIARTVASLPDVRGGSASLGPM
jgi:hydroxymethylbilane synthase